MPRPLPYLLALALGVGAALLVACGSGTKGGIPAASAGDLKSQIEDVQQAVDDGRCEDVTGQLRQVDEGIDGLPASVDERLRQSLRDGSDTLRRRAVQECGATETTTTQTTETTTTATATTPPQTPTRTQTVPPTTTTAPPPTTTPPPTTVPPPPPPTTTPPVAPAEPPVPPAGTAGGGATPEVDPK